jgi:hypothetical protein
VNSRDNPNPLLELAVTIVIPAVILMKLSDPEDLGVVNALLLALAFPLGWGAYDLVRRRKLNLLAVLGLVSVLLTGGIGLLQLDAQWLAVKEAAVPGLIGLAIVGSTATRYPLIRTLVYHPGLLDVERIGVQLEARGAVREFETRLHRATWMLGGTFFFSSAMNYALARAIVVSPTGSPAFNEELGRLTLLSYPAIALPSMAMMGFVLYYLVRTVRRLTGLGLSDVLNAGRS